MSERVLRVARAGLASREQGEAAYKEMIKEYLFTPPETPAPGPVLFGGLRRQETGDEGSGSGEGRMEGGFRIECFA